MGDLNIDLLKTDRHTPTKTFYETMQSFHFFHKICNPTRVKSNSATLIDNIFTSYHENDVTAGILLSDISDHFPIFYISTSSSIYKPTQIQSTVRRQINPTNIKLFSDKLQTLDWDKLYTETDINSASNIFHDRFNHTYDDCFPIRQTNNHKKTKKPWVTAALLRSIQKKNRLYRLWLKTHYPTLNRQYKNLPKQT